MPANHVATLMTGDLYIVIRETFDRDGYETGFRMEVSRFFGDAESEETYPVLSQALARAAVLVACEERNIVPV